MEITKKDVDKLIQAMSYRDYMKIHKPLYDILGTTKEQTVDDYKKWCAERNVKPKGLPKL